MAKGKYQKLYEARMKRLGKDKSTEDDLQNQVNNLKARLAAGGVENPEADDRNALEKWLNLEQDQGIIGDVLELLERPFQAIKTGITSAQEGDSALKGAWEGLSGQKDTEFKEVLMNTGGFEDEKGKLDLVDVLGYAGDVFLDPVNYIPVAGWGKAAKVLDSTGDIMKAYKATSTLDDLVFKAAGKAIKGGAKLADTGIEKGLKYLDETKGIKYLTPDAKSAANLGKIVDEGSDAAGKLGNLEIYKAAKEKASGIFKVPDNVKKSILKGRSADVEQDMTRLKINMLKEKELVDVAQKYLDNQVVKKYNDVDSLLSDVVRFGEYTMDRSISNADLLSMAKKGDLEGKQEFINALNEMIKKDVPKSKLKELKSRYPEPLKIEVDKDGYIKLGKGFDEISLNTAGKTMIKHNYTDEQLKHIDELVNMYSKNEDGFADLVDTINGTAWKQAEGSVPGISKYEEVMGEYLPDTGVHYGDLGKGGDTKYWNMTVGGPRSTGHLGTGTYFVGSKNANVGSLKNGRPTKYVDFSNYNLLKPKSNEDAQIIHNGLKALNNFDSLGDNFEDFDKLQNLLQKYGISKEQSDKALFKVRDTFGSDIYKNASFESDLDSLSTVFMKELGFNGIDVRGLENFDNGSFGSVIYDLKNKVPKMQDEIKPGIMDKINKAIDETQGGSNLAGKFNPKDNYNYVMPHTLTKEAQKLKGTPIGEKLLRRRKHLGSSDEINNYVREVFSKIPEKDLTPEMKEFIDSDADFMETNLLKAIDNRFLNEKGLTGDIRKTKVANDVLLNIVFNDFDEAKTLRTKIDNAYKNKESLETISELQNQLNNLESSSVIKYLSGSDTKIPNNFVRVSKNDFKDILKEFESANKRYGNKSSEKLFKKLKNGITKTGGDIAIDRDIARMMGIVSDQKTINGLQEIYNKYMNIFKKWKTASPTFIMNSFFGNTSNLALSGISPLDQAKYGAKVADIMQNGEKYYKAKLAGETLSKAQDDVANLWYEYRKMGFDKAALDLNEIPEELQDLVLKKTKNTSTIKKVTNFVPYVNNLVNQTFDTSGRLTVMLKSLDDPSYMEKLGVDNVYDAISKVMFDPSMLTSGEKTLKNFIPFYTYSKNNLVFQATNLFKNPTKYARLMKSMRSLQSAATGGNEENMADYLKDSLYIPIPGLDENGNYTVLRANLPFGQLIETVDDPMQSITNMLSPAIKAPIEYATGIDSFTGREIEKFPGEKSSQIPFLTKKQQKFISDFSGLDVPLKSGYRLLTDPMSTITMENNVDTDRISKMYDEIDELRNMMKQYEQEGYEFSTMTELRKANKNNTIAGLDALFAKYGIDQKTYAERKYGQ